MIGVLVVEDGEEYSRNLARFGGSGYFFVRAGSGEEALICLKAQSFGLIFLDMRFDRTDPNLLLGDMAATTERFNGDPVRARRFLEEHQGTYILSAIREAAFKIPAIFSHDFDGEPKRWGNLVRAYAPVYYLPDNASAAGILAVFQKALSG
jgi:CheY-like chemotaxis protein